MNSDFGDSAIVCAGSMASSVVAARSLGRKGVEVHGVAFEQSHPLLHSKHCSEAHVVPSPRDDYQGFTNALFRIAATESVGTLVPMNEYEIYTLVQNSDRFSGVLKTATPDFEMFEKAWDRTQTLKAASNCGIQTPNTALLANSESIALPAVIKSRYSILEDEGQLHYPDVEFVGRTDEIDRSEIRDRMKHDPLVQEYVPDGTEYGYFSIFDEGTPLISFQHRRIRSTSYSGGASAHRVSVRNPEVEHLGERLLRELNWHGPAMVEFRKNEQTGEYMLMEINPRFWGSLALGIRAGIDFPWLYYQLTFGEPSTDSISYEAGVKASYLRAELQHLFSVAFDGPHQFIPKPSLSTTVINQTTSIINSEYDILDLSDFSPFIWDYLRSALKLLQTD